MRRTQVWKPGLCDEFQSGLWPFVASREIAEEIWAVLERKFQKVRFVIARAETENSFRSFQPDLHGLADLHLFSNAIKSCGQLACDRADLLVSDDLPQQSSNDRKHIPPWRLVAIGEQNNPRHIAGLLQSQPVIVVVENLEDGLHTVAFGCQLTPFVPI